MTGFKFAWHFIIFVNHLFAFSECAEGRVACVAKKLAS